MDRDERTSTGSAGGSLTPDQIQQQAFARARKGVDEKEVREFLRRVAGEHEALTRRIAELEEELRHPRVPSEQQLVDLVSEEVARTLRSAQESADEVSSRARHRAAEVERMAAENAHRLRADQLEQATQDAHAIVEAARERGREMVAEARALRERVLSDLNRRRETLRSYIEQVRADRDRFADTYRAVREAVSDAHDELARFESGRPFESVHIDAGPIPTLAPEPTVADQPSSHPASEAEPAPAGGEAMARGDSGAEPRRASRPRGTGPAFGVGFGELPGRQDSVPPRAPRVAEPRPAPAPEPEPEPEPEPAEPEPEPEPAAVSPTLELEPEHALAPEGSASPTSAPAPGGDVDSLFQRIRAGREQQAAPAVADDGAKKPDEQAPVAASAPKAFVEPPREPDADDAELLRRRDEVLTPAAYDLVRRCKRVLQDEQNEVLDALRRQRGRVMADELLPPIAEQLSSWTEVMTPAIDEAYVAARAAISSASQDSPVFKAPQRLVTGLVEVVVTPLRDRLLAAVEGTLSDDPDTDPDVIAQRIGARYREWKGQELDGRIGDVLAAAYARGVYDAAPDGSRLRWVPAQQGQCPDADDNALEPTPRGERFPTGQQFPPAHPGCRCLLAIVHRPRSSD